MHPTSSDLHLNGPLTNVSVAYVQDAAKFIATKVFPKVAVQKQSDLYWRYSKSDWRRTDAQKRAPATETPGVGWNVDTDSYFCHVYGVHKDIDDQLRANADTNFNLDSDATKFITGQLLLRRDIDWAAKYFTTGVWGTEYTGIPTGVPTGSQFLQWDQAASDPLMDTSGWAVGFNEETGFEYNTMVVGADVWRHLKNHPAILDRIKYTQKGVVTEDLVASFFGVDRFLVARATAAVGPQINDASAQDAATEFQYIVDKKSALLCYSPANASLMTPAAGYTFTWSGYLGGNREGIRVKQFRMEPIASDRIEAEATYDMKVVSPDMGVFLADVVA